MQRVVLDRLENGIAVCEAEDGSPYLLDAVLLPPGTKPGMTLCVEGTHITLDEEDSRARRQRILEKMQRLWND